MESIKQFQFSRFAALQTLKNVSENKWEVQPNGFANTIHWNAGHIYVAAETLLHKADNHYEIQNAAWGAFFAPGTSPADWNGEVPTGADILQALQAQSERIANYFSDKLTNKASEAFAIATHNMETVDAILQFVTWHEGIHTGIIQTLNKAI